VKWRTPRSTVDWRLLAIGVVTMVGAWIILAPPGGGPDEPSHLIRSAGLIRGQLEGDVRSTSVPGEASFTVPGWIRSTDPSCYAQDPNAPASCRPSADIDELVDLPSSAANYPVWGHLLPSVGTLAPGLVSANSAARLLAALLPCMLIIGALRLAHAHSALLAAATLVAVTPMAWSTIAQVNPSGLVISGGIAVFVAAPLLDRGRSATWLFSFGFAAMILPRRDGAFWAFTALGVVLLLRGWSLREWWALLSRRQQALLVAAYAVMSLWAIRLDGLVSKLAVLAPLAALALVAARWFWRRPALPRPAKAALLFVAVIVVGMVGASARPQPIDGRIVRLIVSSTGERLHQAIGVLSWLDAPIPDTSLYLFLVAVGVLTACALMHDDLRVVASAGLVLSAAIGMSWVMELAQGDETGTYWQGRYSLPLLVGVPLLLGRADVRPSVERRLSNTLVVAALIVANGGIYAAARRWGVGIYGSMDPTDFNSYGTPIPPIVLLLGHLAGSAAVAAALFRHRRDMTEQPAAVSVD
jgi:hypothetical protein